MNVLFLGAIFALLTLLLGAGLMTLVVGFSRSVTVNAAEIEAQEKTRRAINPSATAGHAIPRNIELDEQLKEARKMAARRAAQLPRGANMGIGRLDTTDARNDKKHASKGVENDPVTAVRIAHFHSWKGLQYSPPTAATTARATTSVKKVKRNLVPGKDYPVAAITDGMSNSEIRTARIANAKAKMAAYKAMKEAGLDMVESVQTSEQPAARAAAPAAAPSVDMPPPPQLIEITDDMSADEVRKARIANVKAQSAYKKALKELGVDPSAANGGSAEAAAAPVAQVEEAAPSASADVPPPPQMIEITDDMSDDEVRSARLSNVKAQSAYKKRLKELGIDPSTVKL